MTNLLKKEKGFTLIEIVLVLAIAGLLLVIVFLAVSGAQKSRRDSQRKSDLSRIAAQLESYAGNNNGCYPGSAAVPGCAQALTIANFWLSSYITGGNFMDPTSGTQYATPGAYVAAGTAFPAGGPAVVTYRYGQSCDNTAGRTYSINMGLEQGMLCRDTK